MGKTEVINYMLKTSDWLTTTDILMNVSMNRVSLTRILNLLYEENDIDRKGQHGGNVGYIWRLKK